jgi:hypothetical protein
MSLLRVSLRLIAAGLVLSPLAHASETASISSAVRSAPAPVITLARGKLQSFTVLARTKGLSKPAKKKELARIVRDSRELTVRECAAFSCGGADLLIIRELDSIGTLVGEGKFESAASEAETVAKTYGLI